MRGISFKFRYARTETVNCGIASTGLSPILSRLCLFVTSATTCLLIGIEMQVVKLSRAIAVNSLSTECAAPYLLLAYFI